MQKGVLLAQGFTLLETSSDPTILHLTNRLRFLENPTYLGFVQVELGSSVIDNSLTPEVTNAGVSPPSREPPSPSSLSNWEPKLSATWTPYHPLSAAEQKWHDDNLYVNA